MEKSIVERPSDRLKKVMQDPTVQEQFKNSLGENSGLFVASLIDLYASDRYLQECSPKQVVLEALKAATLKLPINKNLGFAYVIPYKEKGKPVPQFQIGYRGLIQLAIRSGQFRRINADKVLEGELKSVDKLTGELELGKPTGETVVGYFAFIEMVNGFRKATYWTKDQVMEHAKRFSKAFGSSYSPWKSDFDAMAIKTVLKSLLGKYGIMSIEMVTAFDKDSGDDIQSEINDNANRDFLDIAPESSEGQEEATPGSVVDAEWEQPPSDEPPPMTDEEKAAIEAQEAAEAEGPGY